MRLSGRLVFSFLALLLLAPPAVPADEPASGLHQTPDQFVDTDGQRKPIATKAQWEQRRAEILKGMQRAMGPLPDRGKFPQVQLEVLERAELDGGVRRNKIRYRTDSQDRIVHAWVFFPKPSPGKDPEKPAEDKRAGILCLHQTTGIGKGEPAGLGGLPNLHYALELAQHGFVTLAPDYPSFGEYPYTFPKEDGYVSGTMKAIADNLRAVDILETGLARVDGSRIGCIGHSLGGHNTMFTAAFDPRIKAMVSSCGFTRFHKYYGGKLAGWTSPRYMPLIASEFHNSADEVPFDFPEIVAAFAPRPFLACSPVGDDNFEVSGVKDTIAAATPIYRLYGAEKNLQATYPECAHDFPPETRELAYRFFEKELADNRSTTEADLKGPFILGDQIRLATIKSDIVEPDSVTLRKRPKNTLGVGIDFMFKGPESPDSRITVSVDLFDASGRRLAGNQVVCKDARVTAAIPFIETEVVNISRMSSAYFRLKMTDQQIASIHSARLRFTKL